MNPTETTGERCAQAARRRGDALAGTAAPAAGFLLVEVPGGWGRQALTMSSLDPVVGRSLSERAIARGLRALLIRRPGRYPVPPPRRRWAVVSSRPGRERAWWGEYDADHELLDLPLDGSTGTESAEPVFLVCTHGRHDTCCAVEGRPVAAALDRLRPGQVWECSHVGGDRFAANVVALPHGLYYGHVSVDDVTELVGAHERGEVVPRLLRGPCTVQPAAQAAIALARRELGELRADALTPAGTLHLGAGLWQVRLRRSPLNVMVTLRATSGDEPGLLTCHATRTSHAPCFELVSLAELGA